MALFCCLEFFLPLIIVCKYSLVVTIVKSIMIMLRHYYTVLGFPPLVRRGKQPNVPVNKYRYEGGGASNISFGDCVVGNKTNVNIKKILFLLLFSPLFQYKW